MQFLASDLFLSISLFGVGVGANSRQGPSLVLMKFLSM